MIKEYCWKVYTGMFLVAFLVMTLFAYNGYQQRDYYADLYFNEPVLQEANWNCKINFHSEGVFNIGDFNMVIDSFEIELPCNEAMAYNFLEASEELRGV